MKLNAKTEYALLAMVQLAVDHGLDQPASMRSLAERQPIPDGFLVQILQDLRRAGLVTSTRGATGGYRLARPAHEISLQDVIAAVECCDSLCSNLADPTPLADALVEHLRDARSAWRQRLSEITLDAMAQHASQLHAPMWYI